MYVLRALSRVVDVPGVVCALTRPLFIAAVMLALLVSAGVAHAQGTPTVPTIESVAVTSGPGGDGGYAIGDEIQVGLTFSEAVTVTGIPQLTLDVGGQSRTAEYSEGSTTAQLLFTYTVATGDEDTDGIAVVANSLALNGGAIRAGSVNATLTHGGLQSDDHRVDGIAPTVTVGGETRTYVPPSRQFNVVFYFNEKVYGITDAEITVTNGLAADVRATGGNAMWPRYTRWDVIIVPAAEGPVTVTLEAGAATDAYGNGNNAPGSALTVIVADPVTVEVTRTTSGFAEGGKAAFIVTRSRDNGAIPVSLSLDQTGDFLSGSVEVYPPSDPNNPGEPVVPEEFTFTETPYDLDVTFAAGETSKRIFVLTEDDYRVENDGTVTLSVPAKPEQYKYIPGYASSASADVRNNDVSATVSLYWSRPFNPYTTTTLDTVQEGSSILLGVYGRATGQPLLVTLAVTEVGSYLDLDGESARGYEDLGNGKLRVTLPVGSYFENVVIPLLENGVREADGSVTITVEADPGRNYTPSVGQGTVTIPVKDNDAPSTVSISEPDDLTEGTRLTYTLTRTWEPGQSQAELTVNVRLAQTGDYITWPTGRQPDTDGLVTIPVTIAARSLTATLNLETLDDEVSEADGSVTATILADTNGKYVAGTSSAVTATLLDNDPPIISVEAVAAEVTEGTNAQYRITRAGNTSGSLRVGLYVTGLPKIMTDATETIVLTSDNEDQSQRLTINGAWVDYILEFAAGETEKTVSFTTEADSINEGDGWLSVSILQQTGIPYNIGTGRAQVHVKDDDIPTVSLNRPVGPTGLTLSSDGTTWEGKIVEGTQFTYNSTCTGVTEFSGDARVNLDPVSMWVQYSNHPAFYAEQDQNNTLGYNRAGIHHLGTDCGSQTVTYRDYRFYVGPENGVLEIEIVPRSELVKQGGGSLRYRPRLFAELARQYEAAAAEAQAAGTLITKKNIFHPIRLVGYHPQFACNESDLRYCPQYQVGTVKKIRLTVTNRDPTILIKAESTSVTEGETTRFILERRWATDLLAFPPPQSETVVYLQASQDGQYITGSLPTQITFGQNETRKVIELQTVDDSAFGDNGSVTIELLPDTSTGSVNLHGNYTIWESWVGHTPAGGRSDKATVTITNDDDKPGITIAPASATEGDSDNTNVTFTLTLGQAVSGAVAVNYETSDGTATAGQDYTAVTSGTATIPANSTSATFTVSVTGDTTDEPNETFNVTISLPEPDPDLSDGSGGSPPDVAIVGGDTATVSGTIVDDDPVVVTVAPKADSVVEGQDAVFVLTRTGYTDDALSMQVRLSAPGKVETLSAEFEAGATTTELSVETEDNDLVDYPSARDYTIEALGDGDIGDGDINGGDDEIYTPGTPSQATVSVTDNDKLQIITVHPHEAFVREGGEVRYVFRRTGDTSEELRFTYVREARQAETTEYLDYNFVNERFPAGLSEITTGALVNGVVFPSDQVVNRLYPYTFTAQVYGDGHRYGVHRIWKAGTPDTATVVYYDDDRTKDTVLLANYPNLVQVGQTISIDFELINTGSEATGNTITVSSAQRDLGDRNQTKPAEPRAGCSISGPLATGEIGTCRATFTLTGQDRTDSPMVLDATASDGTTTSSTLRIYITVLGGVAVGFNETARLSVTEPANGAANAKAVLAVTRVGESGQQVQVAYTVEPIHTQNRPYPAEEGADYEDNSATPGILTFAPNETEKNITIDILGDEIDEQKEQFRVTLVPPEGVLVEAAKRNRAVAIVNRDPPSGESYLPTASLELVSADPIPESAGSVDFAVVLDRVWGEDARFEVELDAHDNLTATPAFSRLGQTGDFEAPDGLIHATIPAGQTRFEFSLTLYDDDVREEDETFQMLLGSSITKSQRQIGDEDEVLVTIADDDFVEPTGVELALTSNNGVFDSVAENSSQHNITVTASFADIRWPTDAADAALRPADPRDVDTTVRVEFDSANSAAAQTDIERFQVMDSQGTFQGVESFDIVIPAGQTSGTTTLRFKPANDDVDEEDETVILQGTEVVAADSDEFLPVSSASFTITDDDTRGITVSPASLATGSGIGMMEGGTSTYSLVLDTEPTDTVTVTVASEQDNLIRLTPGTLTFTPSNWSTTQTISVESLDDGADTSFRDAFIAHQVSGGDYGSVSVGDISVIIENTTQAYIYLDDAQASESDGHVEFTVSVRPILRTVPVVVRYTTVDGTAAAGTDYTRQVNTGQTYKIFSIPANGGAATIRIPITDNEMYGPAKKTFTLQLTNQNNKALLDGDATSLTATGSIIDDDPKPEVSVAGPAGDLSYVSEDKKGPVTFTLTLTGRSAADVTVDYATGQPQVLSRLAARQSITSATAGEDYTAATGTVTFSPGDATKQVTVQLTDDDVSEDTEFFGFKISNAQNAQLRKEATEEVADVGLLDDDPRGVAIDPTSISLEEPAPGEAAVASSYTVKLNSKPTDTVTVTIGGANPAVSLSGATLSNTNTLTFTTSNWDTAQTVTVTPVEDANGTGETITLTHMQSGGDYTGIAADSVTVNVTDSDTRNVVLSPTSLTLTEGDDTGVSYTVKLASQPTGAVTVTIGGHAGTDLSISGTTPSNSNTLTFSTSNWNTAQTVTVKAGHDGNSDDESETLTHTASGGDYANVTRDLPVTVTDDDQADIVLSKTDLAVTEGDAAGMTYTVALATEPSDSVTVSITGHDGTDLSLSGITLSSDTLTFTVDDWSTAQTVTVKAGEDGNADDESETLTHTASGGDYANIIKNLPVTVEDDAPDTVTVTFGAASYTVAEGSSRTITVSLDEDPERTVVIPIETDDQGGATDSDYTGVPDSVTFEAGDTSKTFDISATEDNLAEAGEKVKLSFGTLPADATAGTPGETAVSIHDRTQGQDLPTSPTVHFENAAYSVTEGASVAVKVKLSKAPGSEAVIPISRANRAGATNADYSGVPDTLTFGATDTEKTITFAATDDEVDDDGEKVELSFGTLPGGITATSGEAAEATVAITDNDDATAKAILLAPASITVEEENATGTPYTVKLASQPSDDVTVIVSGLSGTDLIISGTTLNANDELTLTFTALNWDTAQTVTVKAAHDADPFGDTAFLLHTATGGGYDSASKALPVTVTDNDTAAVVLDPASITVEEGSATGASYTVKLSHQPSGAVTVTITGHDGTDLTISGTTLNASDELTFTASNWSAAQTVTVKADNDDNAASESLKLTHTPSGGGYSTAADLPVTVTDDDTAAIVLDPVSLSVEEGDTTGVSYTVELSTQPSETVTVTIGGHAGSDLSISGATLSSDTLTFTVDDWFTAQTVTVKAGHDGNSDDESETLTHTASGGDYANITKDLPVTVTDDAPATVRVSFGAGSYTVVEGSSRTVIVTLDADPERTVVIPIEAANEGGASDSDYTGVPESVTFDAGETSKSFDVSAVEDNLSESGERVKLSFGTLPAAAAAGAPSEAAVSINDRTQGQDLPTAPSVHFEGAAYSVDEGATVAVKVKLSKAPGSETVIPIAGTNRAGASDDDYSGVPGSLTFAATGTEKTITFAATDDSVDDDDEKVMLSFGSLPGGITTTTGEATEAVVTIADDDKPTALTVEFGQAAYTAAEGSTVTVKVILSDDPEMDLAIPISKTNDGGATSADYSGVPGNVTFGSGDTEKTFVFTAETDAVDDDGESVKLSFGTLPTTPVTVTAGTTDEATVTITDDDVPSVTVNFGSAAYTVAESDDSDTTDVTENTAEVTVTLDADPERTVVIPISKTNQDGATTADYSGVPQNVTFDSGDTSKSFTFTAAHDTVDDDGESVLLSFGATLPDGVSAGTLATSTVSITDDDDPQVTVAFGQSAYSAAEGSTVTLEVTLSADPERNVSIPIEKTNQGGATAADYTGVPQNVTFDSGETQKSFVFTAETDTDDDDGESVRLSFDTMPDARVSEGSPSEAMVTIRQDSTPSTADCSSAIWCADLEFRSESPPGEMWFLGSNFLDSQFHYGGVTYRFGHSSVAPYGHNIPISVQPSPPWAIPERTKFYFSLHNMNASGYDLDRFRVPNDDWMDWTLHVSTTKNGETLTAVLPFSEARFGGGQSEWRWYGSDLEALRAAWTDGQVYKLKIVEDPRSQRTPKVLGPPLYLKVTPYTNHTLGAWWKMPENRVDRAPSNTTYKVQWKEASDSWDNPADVSEETDSPSPATKETLVHSIRGLTGGVEYHVRVIATNTVGDSEPSEVASGTPTPLPAAGQNIAANSPAKGAPSIEGTPEVGQTLSAVTTDIADDDGLQDVVFSYQWLADDVEISGADGATNILTSDDLGKAINVRVDFTDNAGNEESLTSAPTAAVTAAEDLEIQSATVDGSTLTLTYNETLDTGVTLPASAFVVNVNEASRSIMGAGVGGSSVLLLLSSAVETGDTVTVDYTAPDGQDFIGDTQGRKAESFSGQEVTNNTAPAETERSDPAQTPGSPNSLKVVRHESGKLMATWAAPDSGSDPTGYTLQWKEAGDGWETQDSVSEADVKGTSHLITGLTDGVEYAVRVIASKDDSESAPSGEVTATPRETTPPSPSSVSVNGATLTVTFDEALAEVQALASTAFAVTVAGNNRGVSAVAVAGSAVTLTLVTAVSEGDAVTVDYTAPMGESAARLQDLAGNVAASFSGLDAGNDTQAADQLTASAHDVPGSHDGSTVFTFELRFSENFHLSYKTLRDHAFTVTGGEVTGARRLAPPSNIGWEIQVEPDGDGAATIVLPVTTDCTAEGAICTEDGRMLSGGLLLVVPGPNTPATGLPTITGTAQVGDTLTAVTTGIEDADGLDSAAFSYQWLAADAEINGATASTYTLVAADEGKAIKVQVSFTDDAGNDEELNSAATAAVAAAPPPPNTRATGLPTITGTAEVGDTLTAVTTAIEDADGLDSAAFSYQWLADNADIAGATGSSYTLVAADEGKAIKVQVSFTDDAGNDEELNSAATAAVAAAPPPPNTPATGLPTITGTAEVGDTLTAVTTAIEDADGLDSAAFSYQWLADNADIAGATGSSYTLVAADEGKAIKVQVSFTDDAGNDEELNSAATAAVAAAPPPPNTPATGLPTITGTAEVGDTLTAVTTAIEDADGLDSAAFSYQWLADNADIAGATGSSYTLVAADEGKAIKVQVSFTDDAGNDEELNSAATAAVAAAPPPPNTRATGLPTITGTAEVGDTLTAVTTAIEDADGLDSAAFSYQWLADNADIAGATGSSYTLGDSDVDKTVKVRVSFTDDANNRETETSAATAAVAARPNSLATGAPTISGTAQVGETLTADTSGIADEDGLTNASFAYQWQADGADISGATDSSYTLAVDDESKVVSVKVSFSDDAGNEEESTSAATAAVEADSLPPLTASLENIATSHDGENAFTFELRFSEEFNLSYKTLRDHALTVTGGQVTGARRLVPRSNVGWEIHVQPDGDGTVTIVLPATTDCTAEGAICTQDGRKLSNSLEITVQGPAG